MDQIGKYLQIGEEQIRTLTGELIAFQSLSASKGVDTCAAFICNWLTRNGISAEIKKYVGVSNVVASIGKDGGKRILWNGHFDVVPTGDRDQWTTDPFKASEKDGFLYGRGSVDMKSGIAAMMMGLKAIRDNNIELDGEIVFQAVGDEETGSLNGTKSLIADMGADFDGAIVPEPTDFCIESAQRGLRWIEIKITGRAAHAGRPHIGRNAIEYGAEIVAALKRIDYDIRNDIFEEGLKEPSLSVNLINGGTKENVIAESCTLTLDRRMLPGETEEKIMEEMKAAVESVAKEGYSVAVRQTGKGWNPFVLDPGAPILQCIKTSYEKIVGNPPIVRGKGGCTDASHIFDAGIPVVIFGAGSANESHTSDEKVEISRIARVCEIMIDASIQFLKKEELQ